MKSTYKTKAREEIMAYLKEHTEQRFTAREIFEAVSGKAEGINRTTVYRNLDRLCETGDLKGISFLILMSTCLMA